jgi:hypothetical protein
MLFDELGAKLTESHYNLEAGTHSFLISSSGTKVLYLIASDDKYTRSIKIITTDPGHTVSKIRYSGPVHQMVKSIAFIPDYQGFIFYLGDQLMYTVYATGYLDNTRIDNPVSNTIYIFNMVPDTNVSPTVTTNAVINITQTNATCGGNVTSDGGATVTSRGVCWSTSPNPTTSGSHTSDGGGTGTFISNLTGLTQNSYYYVRAYAINNIGTAYGNEVTFITLSNPPVLPAVLTNGVTNITQTNATSGGNVTSDGGSEVTHKGVCWSTSPNPTTADNHTDDGSGTGTFISNLTGLTANTQYYVRAYATNNVGTGYGDELNFITLPVGAHYIGKSFGGGIIFYIDNTGQHGLISSTSDQSIAEWGCYGNIIGGTGTGIGTGQGNTTNIVSGCSASATAAQICDNLVLNGYSDWFLPSIDELYEMYVHKDVIGNFNSVWPHWSSTEYDNEYVYIVTFWAGGVYIWEKTKADSVRAIRAF